MSFLRNIRNVLKIWRFDRNNFEHVRGLFFYYVNKHRFNRIGYPFILFKNVYIRNMEVISFGNNITIAHNCFISPLSLNVGNNCWLGVNNFICGNVTIGNDVIIGPNVSIPGASHNIFADVPFSESGLNSLGTVICDSVWIGSNVTILDGVTIGKHSVVAANSVITKDIPPYSVVAGAPAKLVRKLD
jgi:acetyltransferase-like isoleucine patch superfamily enzyme